VLVLLRLFVYFLLFTARFMVNKSYSKENQKVIVIVRIQSLTFHLTDELGKESIRPIDCTGSDNQTHNSQKKIHKT